MKSQPVIYSKNKPRVTDFTVNCRLTTQMAKSFRELLRGKLQEKEIKAAELARRSGVTKQNIGRILNDTPHSITGAPPQAERETVIKIATALDWDLDEALLAAGYAPKNGIPDLDELELIERLSALHAHEFSEKDKERFVIAVRAAVRAAKQMIEEDAIKQ